jgi:hypothetical protein
MIQPEAVSNAEEIVVYMLYFYFSLLQRLILPFFRGSVMTSMKENLCTVVTVCNTIEYQINLRAPDMAALHPNWILLVTGYNI